MKTGRIFKSDTVELKTINNHSVPAQKICNIISSKSYTKLYPNPSSSNLNVNYILPFGENSADISIYNMRGVEVMKNRVSSSNGTINFDISNLTSGIYKIQLKTASGYSTTKQAVVVE